MSDTSEHPPSRDEAQDNSDERSDDAKGEESSGGALTVEQRMAKLNQLRSRMRESANENRKEVITESSKLKASVRDAARRERQLKLAETLRIKAEADEAGEDLERKKNWEWSIADNDEWEKKQRRKARNADFEYRDEEQQARKRYKKDLNHIKPDLEAYNKQKAIALGLAPGSSAVSAASSTHSLATFDPQSSVTPYEQQLAAESLYRDANSLIYADSKPTEEAIDRVIGKLNIDQDKRNKFSRKRLNEDKGDITYINEHNRVFNNKIARYYDKYTTEIRASFERGTAL